MSEVIERVARAIASRRCGYHPDDRIAPQYIYDAKVAIEAMPGWEPIEVAPRNGIFVLIGGVNRRGDWYTAVAKWDAETWMQFDPAMDDFCVESSGHSHWMPLPAPPAALKPEVQP